MTEPETRRLVANRLAHHVLVWNDPGEVSVVLCHGFLDQAYSFAPVAERLAAAGLRVVAFDWRGHGQTQHVGAGGYYHFPDYVLDLHELAPQLASGPVHLVGHSMGGTVAVMYTATHPGVVRSLAVVEGLGPPSYRASAPDKLRGWLESVDRQRRRGAPRPIADLSEAVKRLRVSNPDLPAELALELAETGTEPNPDGEGLRWRFDPLHRTTSPTPFFAETFREYLKRVWVPTLVVSGTRGFRTDDHDARVAALPDAREATVDDVGHMIHQLRPGSLAALIEAHVARTRR